MSDFEALRAVRSHLLNKEIAFRVHLALPPQAIYPLILIELEEIWSPFPIQENDRRKGIQARVKFKISIYSQTPGMEEVALLSSKIRKILEGETISVPAERGREEIGADKLLSVRFLACVTEGLGNGGSNQRLRVIHHFYDALLRR